MPDSKSSVRTPAKPNGRPVYDDQFVIFLIGEEEHKFTVHKSFACYYCEVFNRAFNSNFEEARTQTYRIKDTTVRAFELLVDWIYSQDIGDCHFEAVIDGKEVFWNPGEVMARLAELWVLADKLLLPNLQNIAIDHLNDVFTEEGACMILPYVYENTAEDSLLRRFLIEAVALNGHKKIMHEALQLFTGPMLLDFAKCLLAHRPDEREADTLEIIFVSES